MNSENEFFSDGKIRKTKKNQKKLEKREKPEKHEKTRKTRKNENQKIRFLTLFGQRQSSLCKNAPSTIFFGSLGRRVKKTQNCEKHRVFEKCEKKAPKKQTSLEKIDVFCFFYCAFFCSANWGPLQEVRTANFENLRKRVGPCYELRK